MSLLEKIDALIITGQLAQARRALVAAGKAGEYSGHRLAFARIARRLDLPMLALRILHPVISPLSTADIPKPVSAEYAASLTLVGAYREAEKMLSDIPKAAVPESLLFRAFNRIAQWDYAGALPLLADYSSFGGLSPYQKIIADINLAISMNYERREGTGPFLDDLLERARGANYVRLVANLLLQKAQWEFYRKDWSAAFRALNESLTMNTDEQSIDRLLIQKWICFVSLFAYADRREISLKELDSVRKNARALRDWETVRSCDYYDAVVTGNVNLAKYIVAGTPHRSFTDRLSQEFPVPFLVPRVYQWRHPPDSNEPPLEILEKGENSSPLRYGQTGHRLLMGLVRDFYRPIKLAELHSIVFPREVFNPVSSPVRIRKLVQRIREALSVSKIPLRIDMREGMFSLVTPPHVAINVPVDRCVRSPVDKLRDHFDVEREFGVAEVADVLKLSPYRAARLVYRARNDSHLERKGSGASVKYFFPRRAA